MHQPVRREVSDDGVARFHLVYDPSWDGVESLAEYLVVRWRAVIVQRSDGIYSREWSVRVDGGTLHIRHDGYGNYFFGGSDCPASILQAIAADLTVRFEAT